MQPHVRMLKTTSRNRSLRHGQPYLSSAAWAMTVAGGEGDALRHSRELLACCIQWIARLCSRSTGSDDACSGMPLGNRPPRTASDCLKDGSFKRNLGILILNRWPEAYGLNLSFHAKRRPHETFRGWRPPIHRPSESGSPDGSEGPEPILQTTRRFVVQRSTGTNASGRRGREGHARKAKLTRKVQEGAVGLAPRSDRTRNAVASCRHGSEALAGR
jgi:hypothetical protein